MRTHRVVYSKVLVTPFIVPFGMKVYGSQDRKIIRLSFPDGVVTAAVFSPQEDPDRAFERTIPYLFPESHLRYYDTFALLRVWELMFPGVSLMRVQAPKVGPYFLCSKEPYHPAHLSSFADQVASYMEI